VNNTEYGYKRNDFNCVYPFGMDPRWAQSDQALNYSNNLKMKIAVILGILQMSLGICMKGFNAIHFRSTIDFVFEFIPQILLILCLFGWMDILIIAKWLYTINLDDVGDKDILHNSPAIITTMINIFLSGAEPPQGSYEVVGGQ
jgi:V-type H+-transporting ATPase subunit a